MKSISADIRGISFQRQVDGTDVATAAQVLSITASLALRTDGHCIVQANRRHPHPPTMVELERAVREGVWVKDPRPAYSWKAHLVRVEWEAETFVVAVETWRWPFVLKTFLYHQPNLARIFDSMPHLTLEEVALVNHTHARAPRLGERARGES